MQDKEFNQLWNAIRLQYKSHPWHGIHIGDDSPEIVTVFIEITPTDTVKYEIDKKTGYLKIDRPQKFSNIVPALYGFVPQTYCKEKVAEFCQEKTGRQHIKGDDDPLDICVISDRNIIHGNIIVQARPLGGFRLIDNGEADDKIIAVLKEDRIFYAWKDISDLPEPLKNRLLHYFLTYKKEPFANEEENKIEITDVYGKQEAFEVIKRSRQDYINHYGESMENSLRDQFKQMFKGL